MKIFIDLGNELINNILKNFLTKKYTKDPQLYIEKEDEADLVIKTERNEKISSFCLKIQVPNDLKEQTYVDTAWEIIGILKNFYQQNIKEEKTKN